MTRLTRIRTLFVTAVLAVAALAAGPGCVSQAQRDFTVADVQVIGLYLAKAQPAVEAQALATGDAQLAADTRALASEIAANANLRLDALRADQEAVVTARAILDAVEAILDALASSDLVNAPAAQGDAEVPDAAD